MNAYPGTAHTEPQEECIMCDGTYEAGPCTRTHEHTIAIITAQLTIACAALTDTIDALAAIVDRGPADTANGASDWVTKRRCIATMRDALERIKPC